MFDDEFRRDFREGAAALALCNLGDYVSGFFLQYFKPLIARASILLAILPAASATRGNVYSSYGSRLGTLLHLGFLEMYLEAEFLALSSIIVLSNTWIGLLVYVVSVLLEGGTLNVAQAVFIALCSAGLSALLMVPSTTWLAMASFKRGIDPDNIIIPVSTLFGDLATVPSIILAYILSTKLPGKVMMIVSLASLGLPFYAFVRARKSEDVWERFSRVLRENLSIIMLVTLFDLVAGVILVANLERIVEGIGVLAVIPAFLEDGGAIAGRFASRISTKLHLGGLKPSILPRSGWVYSQFLLNLIHASMVFGLLGMFGAAVALVGGSTPSWALHVLLVVLSAGLLLSTEVSIVTYYIAIASYKARLDPDNVLAPVLTSLADVLGTATLAAMLLAAG